jgi:hypothetical protein
VADITIKLVYNLKTGKQDIYVDFVSDDDALPIEHERDHRQLVEQLIGQGVLKPNDVGQVKVSRLRGVIDLSEVTQEVHQELRESEGQGS